MTSSSWPSPQRILVYVAEGQLVGPIAQGGEGPGEFGRLGRIGLRGDTLHAADKGLRRVTFFTRAGDLLGSVRWASPSIRDGRFVQSETPPQVLLSDGSGLVEPNHLFAMRAGETGTQTLANIHRPFAEALEPSTFQMTSRSVTYEPVPMSDEVVDEAIAAIRTPRLERDQPAPTAG